MNARARLARRILRDHRRCNRRGYIYGQHVRRDFKQPALGVYTFWTCPRCVVLTAASGQGRLERLPSGLEEAAANGLRQITPEMAKRLLRHIEPKESSE